MSNVIYLPIVGYNGYYQVSNYGDVRSEDRHIDLEDGNRRFVKGRSMKQKNNGEGYLSVVLSFRGKASSNYVHRLVAGAFINNPDGRRFVNHKDGNPSNNKLDNLEWVDHSSNVKHGYETGLNSNQGGNHSFAVGVIDNQLGMKFDTIKEWCKVRGINYSTGRNILNGYSSLKKVDKTKIIVLKPKNYGRTK